MLQKLPLIIFSCGILLLCACVLLANANTPTTTGEDRWLMEAARILRSADRAVALGTTSITQAAAALKAAEGGAPAAAATAAVAAAAAMAPSADPTCHTAEHTGYSGDRAVVWGLGKPGFHLRDAGECCKACQAHAATCSKPGAHSKSWWPDRPEMTCGGNPPCNIWTFCPEERCFAFDIHKHVAGECWLKQQAVNHTNPKDPHEGHKTYPNVMRFSPRKIWPWAVAEDIWTGPMPESIPWVSGVLAPADATITSAPPDDKWRRKWCAKHGPCE